MSVFLICLANKNNARQVSYISELGLSKIIMTRKSLKDEKEVKKNKQSETEYFIDKGNSKIIVSLFQKKLREALIDILMKKILSTKRHFETSSVR